MANVEKLEKIMKDEKVVAALKACETEEAMLACLNEQGAEVTAEELKALMPGNDEAMNLDDMEAVAGGGLMGLIDAVKDLFSTGIHKQDPNDVMKTEKWEDGSTVEYRRNGTVVRTWEYQNGLKQVVEYESVMALKKVSDIIIKDGEKYATPQEYQR